ncbi:MAG TPA: hypothetical protein PKV43_08205, partial [Armatimonadota bacterium]|nr:hypothetical protein [Armatimonadota bacterium]
NGGYKLYLDNGVTVAARDLYMKDNVVMEVTVHTMKSKDAANKFFEYWRKEYNPQAIDKQKTYSMFISRKPAVGWMVSGIYLVSAVPSKDGEQQIKDTKAFLHQVRKKIETAQK